MAIRQQAMINVLGKYCRQYFLFKDEPGMDQIKVRLRSDIHRTEQADREDINSRLLQRLRDNQIGLLNPQHKPYEPVSGWPVLNLDDLVLTAMADQLDEKVWQAVRSQFEKFEVKKQHEKRGGEAFLKDFSTVHQCPTSGFNAIKNHLAESEQRIHSVKAGFDFHGHFLRKCEARSKKDLPIQSTLRKYDATPKFETC
ncbi:uncharacterized protein [Littorina saxatilis]|uniref:uncharacterized protein n=1 Tax=Littorina saxatilis TaxID=31220 RepID=UPI0038B600C5